VHAYSTYTLTRKLNDHTVCCPLLLYCFSTHAGGKEDVVAVPRERIVAYIH
jgi:hypothetical protein